jgi:hypothetical protein
MFDGASAQMVGLTPAARKVLAENSSADLSVKLNRLA